MSRPELRQDPVTGRWVILAPERARRPRDFRPGGDGLERGAPCPFCEGHEDRTPPEVLARRAPESRPDGPGWRVRVVPNLYPAVLAGEGAAAHPEDRDLFRRRDGAGVHEVIVESPRHLVSLTALDEAAVAEVLEVWQERLRGLARVPGLAHALIFKNVGARAGASLEHVHTQLIALPAVPFVVEEELSGARRHRDATGRCVFCDVVGAEEADGRRVVLATGAHVALEPWAPRFPYETHVLPRAHAARFEDLTPGDRADLARVLRDVLARVERALDAPHYNLLVHSAPFVAGAESSYHWHIEILPRLARLAGFEWGTGFHITAPPPEAAAARLKEQY
jgi:UDPglucose--hexose-1-phosphate uridylyltransferase